MLVRLGSPRVVRAPRCPRHCRRLVGLVGLPAVAQAAAPTTPFISEIHYDNTGTDVGEFVEVEFPAGTSSAGWKVVLYNGNGGAVYDAASRQPLPSRDRPRQSRWSTTPRHRRPERLPDGLALVRPDGTVAEFLSYEGAFTAVGGPANGMTSTDIGVAEAGTEPAGLVAVAHATTPRPTRWSGQARRPTPRARSTRPARPSRSRRRSDVCDLPRHARDRRGAGQRDHHARSPGQQVTVRGVVVGDVPGLGGFYLQDVDGDGNTATSDGIFVVSPVAGRPRRHRRRERRGRRELRPDPDHVRRGRLGLRRRRRDRPAGPGPARPAGDRRPARAVRGHARRPGRHPDRQRGLRPHPLRRADPLRGRPAGAADRARPTRHPRGRGDRGRQRPPSHPAGRRHRRQPVNTNRPYLSPDHPGAGR